LKKKPKNYDLVLEYANSIVEGQKVACKEQIQGCQRFLDDLKNPLIMILIPKMLNL